MRLTSDDDVTSISIRLNELRSRLDQGLRQGDSLPVLREIHLQIKELECYLTAMEWNPTLHASSQQPAQRGNDAPRYRHIQESPPLL